jgi:hypothetical protein
MPTVHCKLIERDEALVEDAKDCVDWDDEED